MTLWIILGIIAVLLVMAVVIYNRLVALRQTRHQAFADIDVQLTQRFDLIPNLVETVKAYAAHEKQVFENVTEARAGIQKAESGDLNKRIKAENNMSQALMNLFAVAENYPDLKADKNFQKLMDELSDIENKIAAARRFFNNATSEYNTSIEQFPAILFAGMFGFSKEEFFEIENTDRVEYEKAPDVKFN